VWVAAIPYALLGPAGLLLTAAAVNAAALVLSVIVGWRRGGPPMAVAVTATGLLLCWSLGTTVIRDPLNSHVGLLLWFALGLLPILNLVSLPTSTVIAERYFFIPAVGLWLIAGATLDRAWRLPSLRAPVAIAGCLVVGALAARSFVRTLDWRDNLSLDRAAVAVEPRSATAHLNLGSSLQSHGDIAGAWREWNEAARLAPTDAAAWAAMGLQAQREGDAPKAEKLLRAALHLDLRHVEARMGLGSILDDAGDPESARAEWEAVLRIDPRHTGALVQLGTSWAMRGDLSRAERYFRGALTVDPALPEALFDMGKLSEQAGRPGEAVTFYRRYLSAPGADQQAARVAADRIRLLAPASPR
jgi:Flp pilus assembly protein TadD